MQVSAIHPVNMVVSAQNLEFVGALEHGPEVAVSNVSLL